MARIASLSTSFSHTIIQQDVEDHQTESPDTYYAYCAQAWDEIATTEASSLNDEIRNIKDGFRAISTYLSKLDKRSKPILRVFFRGPQAGTWSGRWYELRRKFDDFLDESRTKFVAIIENNAFVESGSLNALKKELMKFTKLLGHKRDVAASMRKKFERISDDIKVFKDELQQRLESDKMPSQELHDNLAKTLNEISSLEDRLAT
ncbi:hypothetical protein BN946_scf184784.g4 [Trametes cinnabarina]|uniref:Uncharacterized protein n=1 Tax=Pycnoporus cinnabarinus TaxID=5643 RepID=A0A060S1R4_PYCCI|nr:hypothetical protein BN946_scf184784.g4 [Trametes cinnabarina]